MTTADSCIRVAVKIRNANARVVKSLGLAEPFRGLLVEQLPADEL
jgi:hypothetical protein